MKNFTTRLITVIALSLLFACEPEQKLSPANVPPTTIIMNLEEEHFLFDGHWYPWATPIMQCNPTFSLDLNWEEGMLSIKHCQSAIDTDLRAITLHHSNCSEVQVQQLEIREDRSLLTYIAQISPEGISCLRQDHSWLEVYLEWE